MSTPRTVLTAILSSALPLIAVYSYFTGWMYLYFFYEALGVSLVAIDFPFHFFLVYSFTIFSDIWKFISIFIILIVVSIAVAWCYSSLGCEFFKPASIRLSNLICQFCANQILAVSVLIIVSITTFYALSAFARDKALSKADEVRRGGVLNHVDLTFKSTSRSDYPPRLLKAASEGSLMKLLQTRDHLFVILQPGQDDDLLPSAFSYSVSLSDLTVVDTKLDRPVDRVTQRRQLAASLGTPKGDKACLD